MTGEQRVTEDGREGDEWGTDREKKEVKGETGIGGLSCRLDEKRTKHSSASLQSFQFTDSLENRMNGRSEEEGGGYRGGGNTTQTLYRKSTSTLYKQGYKAWSHCEIQSATNGHAA